MTERGRASAALLMIGALVLGVLGGVAGAALYTRAAAPTSVAGSAAVTPMPPQRVQIRTDQDAIVKAVAAVDPAVVKIVATSVVEPSNPFEYFFGGLRVERGMGSGFVFDYEGRKLILTNTHVVGDAQEITVKLKTGQQFKGKLLGADASSDVAVIEIEGAAENLPAAQLGNSDALNTGEWVVAIGHPYEFEHTVTVGVVSAQGYRAIPAGRGEITRNVIQTDAAINQGNSGGPLISLAGEVIGINSMIFSTTGATMGIGFAIPINEAKQVIQFLIHGGPWVGIAKVLPNSEGLAHYLGLRVSRGVVVLDVTPNSPVAQAGLRRGDVVLSVDGQRVDNVEQLREGIFKHQIGDTIRIQVQRGDTTQELSVKAGKVPREYYR